jgi:putative transcriptional regulator
MKNIEKPRVATQIIHGLSEFAESLEKKERIADRFTCRVIQLDIQPSAYDPSMVQRTRKILHASQAVFARFLGVSVKTVRAWEQGVNVPSAMACRFMDEIRRDPTYWVRRLRAAVVAR